MGQKSTFGTTFQISASAITGSTGKLANAISVGFPNPQQGTIDITNHDSANGFKEFLPNGLVEFSEIKVKIQIVPGDTTDVACTTAATSKALQYWQLNSNGAAASYKYNGQGIVTAYDVDDAPIDGIYTATVTIKPTGSITRA